MGYVAIVVTNTNNDLVVKQGGERMSHNGLRLTPQRRQVYSILLQKRDHPTANEVFLRVKQTMPEISMATVYNCLDALVQCGLVRQVNLDRGASRFCPNMQEHCHFHCESCGGIFDLDFNPEAARQQVPVPAGFTVTHFDISVRGLCAICQQDADHGKVTPKKTQLEARPDETMPLATE